MCIICRLTKSYHFLTFLVAVDIIRDKWLECLFVRSLYEVAARHQLPRLLNHMEQSIILDIFFWFQAETPVQDESDA